MPNSSSEDELDGWWNWIKGLPGQATIFLETMERTEPEPEPVPEGSKRSQMLNIFRLVKAVFSLIGFICMLSVGDDHYSGRAGGWFMFVAMSTFWMTQLFLVLSSCSYLKRFRTMLLMVELWFDILWCLFYLIASSLVAARGGDDDAWAAGAFFGFLSTAIFLADVILKVWVLERVKG